jgi:hypothetical protein
MGYEGERASPNQYSSLLEYCKKNVMEELQEIYDEDVTQTRELRNQILSFIYKPKPLTSVTPLLSFDGGMATLFHRQMTETCLLKVSGACPPQFESQFKPGELKSLFFHTFVGRLSYSNNNEDPELVNNVIQKELIRILNIPEFIKMLSVLEVEPAHFSAKLKTLANSWKDKASMKDCFRELLEWALVIDFIANRKYDKNQTLPFLVIKDGNLSSNAKAVTGTLAEKMKLFIKGENAQIPIPYIVGAVKSSRYTGDNAMGTIVKRIASEVPSHSFFKLPKKFEAALDKDFANNSFKRFFLSLFHGDKVFEIQIPLPIANNQDLLESTLDLIGSQVTFEYGGSIATNSFAHIKASLAESEAKNLENTVRAELYKESKETK